MVLKYGNLWHHEEEYDLVLVPANSQVVNGKLVMGAGFALDAKNLYPHLPLLFGKAVRHNKYGLIVVEGERIGLFQTKQDPRKISMPWLIELSTRALKQYCEQRPTERIALPFPGIGFGRLSEDTVLPIIKKLPDTVHVWKKEAV